MARLEMRDVVRSESHKTVRPDWIAHSCAPGTYRLLFGTTRACVPGRSGGRRRPVGARAGVRDRVG